MLTATENKDVAEEAIRLGASDYIIKPFSSEYLQTSVSEKIENLTKESNF